MRILEIESHRDRCMVGIAISRRRRRYRFVAWPETGEIHAARELKMPPGPNGGTYWWHVKPSPALRREVERRLAN